MPLANNKCPTCDKKLNAATSTSGEDVVPKPGDISICFYCGSTLSFQTDLSVKRMEIDELLELPTDVQNELREALSTILKFKLKG